MGFTRPRITIPAAAEVRVGPMSASPSSASLVSLHTLTTCHALRYAGKRVCSRLNPNYQRHYGSPKAHTDLN